VGSEVRLITLALTTSSPCNLGRPNCLPTKMTYDGREWAWSGGGTLTTPEELVWNFSDQATEYTVQTPSGGRIRYVTGEHCYYFPASLSMPPACTNVMKERHVTDVRGVANGTWIFVYGEFYALIPNAVTVLAPGGIRTTFAYNATQLPPSPSGNTSPSGNRLTSRTVHKDGVADPLETETRTYQWVSIPSTNTNDASLEPATVTIDRDGQTHTTTYTYDSASSYGDFHQPRTITSSSGGKTRTIERHYTHSANAPYSLPYIAGLSRLEKVTVTEEGTFETSRTFDITGATATGFMTSETINGVTTTFDRDNAGNVDFVRKENGTETSFVYERGQVKQAITAKHTMSREINPDGTIASDTRAGRTTTFEYDELMRVKETRPPGANPVTTEYDRNGAFVRTRRGNSNVTTTLDGFGRPIRTEDSQGTKTKTEYDAFGRVTFQSYPFTTGSENIGTFTEYDGLGRVAYVTNTADQTTRVHTYGANTVSIKDEKNHTTTSMFEAFGHPNDTRLKRLTDAKGSNWEYTYNSLGLLRKVEGPDNVVREWQYFSGTNLLQFETHPESGTTTYEYDEAGMLTDKTDQNNVHIEYDYDSNDRLETVTAADGVTTITYESGSDNRESTSENGVASAYTYDPSGRLRRRTDTVDSKTFETQFGYDTNDNLELLTYPSGRSVRYVYDSENRIVEVRNGATNADYASGIQYHPSGAVERYKSGNGVWTTNTFDDRHRLKSITASNLQLTYGYDNVSNVTSITDSRPEKNQTLEYDELDRLKRATSGVFDQVLDYDAHGNRTGYTYDPNNRFRLTSIDGNSNMTYQANGNMATRGQESFTYTSRNMLKQLTGGATTTQFAYDADDWRVKKSAGGLTTIYTRGPNGQLLSEYTDTGANATVKDYIYLGSRLIAVITATVPAP
jgi:YD repeat-containing protein